MQTLNTFPPLISGQSTDAQGLKQLYGDSILASHVFHRTYQDKFFNPSLGLTGFASDGHKYLLGEATGEADATWFSSFGAFPGEALLLLTDASFSILSITGYTYTPWMVALRGNGKGFTHNFTSGSESFTPSKIYFENGVLGIDMKPDPGSSVGGEALLEIDFINDRIRITASGIVSDQTPWWTPGFWDGGVYVPGKGVITNEETKALEQLQPNGVGSLNVIRPEMWGEGLTFYGAQEVFGYPFQDSRFKLQMVNDGVTEEITRESNGTWEHASPAEIMPDFKVQLVRIIDGEILRESNGILFPQDGSVKGMALTLLGTMNQTAASILAWSLLSIQDSEGWWPRWVDPETGIEIHEGYRDLKTLLLVLDSLSTFSSRYQGTLSTGMISLLEASILLGTTALEERRLGPFYQEGWGRLVSGVYDPQEIGEIRFSSNILACLVRYRMGGNPNSEAEILAQMWDSSKGYPTGIQIEEGWPGVWGEKTTEDIMFEGLIDSSVITAYWDPHYEQVIQQLVWKQGKTNETKGYGVSSGGHPNGEETSKVGFLFLRLGLVGDRFKTILGESLSLRSLQGVWNLEEGVDGGSEALGWCLIANNNESSVALPPFEPVLFYRYGGLP